MTPWTSLTQEQRGRVCERIWRRLLNSGPTSATGLMHECALPLDNVGGALAAMELRGAVKRAENRAGVELWSAIKRS